MPKNRQAKPKPKAGKLAGYRQIATGFSESYHTTAQGKIVSTPNRSMVVPLSKIGTGPHPVGSIRHGNSLMIPVHTKSNPRKAVQKIVGRQAMENRAYSSKGRTTDKSQNLRLNELREKHRGKRTNTTTK